MWPSAPGTVLLRLRALAAALALSAAGPAVASYDTEWVEFPALEPFDGRPVPLSGLMYRPLGTGPFPALVLMHGCGGMVTNQGYVTASYRYWAERLALEGYVALLVDSFGPRGYRSICELQVRPIRESRERADDIYAAQEWLAAQPHVARNRIGVIGWSNGASGTLYGMRESRPRRGIRAAVCHDTYTAHQAVEHDDLNVLCLGARVVGSALASEIVDAFLAARFSGEARHRQRLDKLLAIEKRFAKPVT